MTLRQDGAAFLSKKITACCARPDGAFFVIHSMVEIRKKEKGGQMTAEQI